MEPALTFITINGEWKRTVPEMHVFCSRYDGVVNCPETRSQVEHCAKEKRKKSEIKINTWTEKSQQLKIKWHDAFRRFFYYYYYFTLQMKIYRPGIKWLVKKKKKRQGSNILKRYHDIISWTHVNVKIGHIKYISLYILWVLFLLKDSKYFYFLKITFKQIICPHYCIKTVSPNVVFPLAISRKLL